MVIKKKAIAKQVSQARKAMFLLFKKASKLQLPVDIQCQLFDHMVLPILLYGSEIWGFQDIKQIEVFHRKFMKYILHLHSCTPSCMVYGELGRTELIVHVKCRMLNFWSNIVTGKRSKFSHIMYKVMRCMHDNSNNAFHSKWLDFVQTNINATGYSHLWTDNPKDINRVWVKHIMKQRLNDMYKQQWLSELNDNSQCTVYRIFKEELCFEQYLNVLDYIDYVSLCKFRCRSHKLPVCKDRFNNLPFTELVCPLCNVRDIGDEFHYLLKCPYFNEERSRYVQKNKRITNTLLFKNILSNDDPKYLKSLCKFLRIIMSTFKSNNSSITFENRKINIGKITKSGRVIIAPDRLNL